MNTNVSACRGLDQTLIVWQATDAHISMADELPSSLAARRTMVAQLLKKAMEDC